MQIAIRVDASPEMGAGHFMRCLTLANAAALAGAHVRVLSRALPAHLQTMLSAQGHEFVPLAEGGGGDEDLAHSRWLGATQDADAAASIEALSGRAWDWVVVDHYGIDARWQRRLRAVARRVLAIDDLADRDHDCDVLLDQNAYVDMASRYRGRLPRGCRTLLGPAFALLRPEFARERETTPARAGAARRILISFGGDPANHTARAIAAVAGLSGPPLHVDVIIGGAHSARAAIEQACQQRGYTCHVQTDRMAHLMARADLAIGAGGSETWERCCLGLPAIVVAVAENQRQLVHDAAGQGLLYAPDPAPADGAALATHVRAMLDNSNLRSLLSRNGRACVDGRGATRAVRELGVAGVAVRPASPGDSPMVFEWRNHPAVREVSRSTAPIDPADHERWFAGVLQDPERTLLIGTRDGEDIGVVRFDVQGVDAEVSIYLAPGVFGAGIGRELLAAAEAWLVAHRPRVRGVRAEVLGHNDRSHRFFAASGYALESSRYRKQVSA